MTEALNIVHEADTQRQHVRVHLPASIQIQDTLFSATDWSNAGMRVSATKKSDFKNFKKDDQYKAILNFEFDSFTLNVPMNIQIRNINEKDNLIGIQFVEMTHRQISIMHHLVNAYVTGELTNINDLIHIVGRNNTSNPRKIPEKENNNRFDFGNFIRKLIVGFFSLFLVSYVAMAIYEQAYIVKAQSAIVAVDDFPVLAPAQGIVGYKGIENGASVSKGEALLTILSNTGTSTSADSPCDCIITHQYVSKGGIVSKNDSVISLAPNNTPLYINAYVPYDQALSLNVEQSVMIGMRNDTISLAATIDSIQLQDGSANNAKIRLTPNGKIPYSAIGMPVEVRIDTMGWAF